MSDHDLWGSGQVNSSILCMRIGSHPPAEPVIQPRALFQFRRCHLRIARDRHRDLGVDVKQKGCCQ